MTKNQLLIVFMFLCSVGVLANGIKGKVTDSNNKPLSGASVRILNSSFGTVTNELGEYAIQKVKGKVVVEFSFIGYKSFTKELDSNEEVKLDVVLEQSAFVYDDVVVAATRAKEDDPFAVTTISKAEMQERQVGEALPVLLNVAPSVVSFTENGTPFGNTAFRVRGSDATRINITIDGVPVNDQESQAVFWVNMTDFAQSTEDIQIQRGVGTSTNGTAAFGASVNLQTNGYAQEAFGEASIMMGSFNTSKVSAQVNTGLVKDHFVFNARLSKLSSDGYVDYSGMNNQSYFVSGGYFSDKTKIRLKVFGNEEHTDISWWGIDKETLESDRTFNPAGWWTDKDGNEHYYKDQKDNYWQNHFHLNLTQELSENLSLNATGFYTKGKGYYEQMKTDEDYADYGFATDSFIVGNGNSGIDTTLFSSNLTRQKWLDNDFYGGNISLNYENNGWNGIFGASMNRYDGDHFGKILWAEYNPGIATKHEWYRNNSIKDDFSSFIKVTKQFTDNWSVYGDIQYRNIQYTMKGQLDDLDMLDMDQEYNFLNPKAGVTFVKDNHTAFASYAMANREPSRATITDAAQDLTAIPTHETLHDFELGYSYRATQYAINVNGYYMLYKDQLVPTGEKNKVGYDILTNVPESYRMGIELAAIYTPVLWFKWEINATLSKNIIEDFTEYVYLDTDWGELDEPYLYNRGNTPIAYSPNVIGANILTFYPVKGLTASLTSKYVSEQYFENTGLDVAKLDAYFVNDIMIGYKFPVKGVEYIELKFKVNNVFNVDYIGNALGGKGLALDKSTDEVVETWRWAAYYPQAFRNFLVQLNVRF